MSDGPCLGGGGSGVKQPAARANRLDRVLLGASLVAAVSFVAWRTGRGNGLGNDTYAMLVTWQEMVHHGRYVASRYTGYIDPLP